MRVYCFALTLCAAFAGVIATASTPPDSAIPLANIHDAVQHHDGVHLERSLMVPGATDHEARSPVVEQLKTLVESMATKVKAWAGRFAQHASSERLVSMVKAWAERLVQHMISKLSKLNLEALAKEIEEKAANREDRHRQVKYLIYRLTAEEVDGLAKLYKDRGEGKTPDAALANVLAGLFGDDAMVFALTSPMYMRQRDSDVGRVARAMIARWRAGDYTPDMMIRWMLKWNPSFPDHAFFAPRIQKILNAAGRATSPNDVYEALFNHFGKNVYQFTMALDAAANSRYHDREAVRACVRWLIPRQNLELDGRNYDFVYIWQGRVGLLSFESRPALFRRRDLFFV